MQNIHQKLSELKVENANLKNMFKNGGELNYTNILVWSRVLVNHIQQLRSYNESLFDKWFHEYRLQIFGKPAEEAKKLNLPDKIIDYFMKARDSLEHEEMPKFHSIMQVKHLSIPQDLGPKPVNATGVFVDGFGVGWQIELPDGTSGKLYVRLSEDKVKLFLKPIDMPTIEGKSLNEMLEYLINYLTNMVEDAVKVFS